MKPVWLTCGFMSLGLGIIGIPLPVLPTTPFVLLAAFCFAKSSDKFHTMLLEHRLFGPMIKDWERNGAISARSKIVAVSMMALVLSVSIYLGIPTYALILQGICLSGAAIFVLSRPNN